MLRVIVFGELGTIRGGKERRCSAIRPTINVAVTSAVAGSRCHWCSADHHFPRQPSTSLGRRFSSSSDGSQSSADDSGRSSFASNTAVSQVQLRFTASRRRMQFSICTTGQVREHSAVLPQQFAISRTPGRYTADRLGRASS